MRERDRIALTGRVIDSETVIDADELGAIATAMATAVGDRPTRSRVVLATSSFPDFVGAVVGAMKAGAVAAPLSDRVPRPGSQQAGTLSTRAVHADASLAIGDDRHAAILSDAGFEQKDSIGRASTLWQRPAPASSAHPRDAALLLYTSGTSNDPKGVMLSQTAIEAIEATNRGLYDWRDSDAFLAMLPLTHLAGLTNCLSALRAGIDVVICPSIVFAGKVRETLSAHPVTVVGGVPYQLGRLFEPSHSQPVDNLRLVVSSAAPLTRPVVAAIREAAPDVDLRNAYGLTEAFRSFVRRIGGPGDDLHRIGQPVTGVASDVREGELRLRGPNVMIGYWRRQPDGVLGADGWFATGDLAEKDGDRGFRLLGRRSGLVNVGGEKLPVEEIEVVLHDELTDRVAIHAARGPDGDDVVTAVAEHGSLVTAELLARACAGRLSAAFRPGRLVMVARLPRTGTGKVDRRALDALVTGIDTATT